MMPPSPVRDLPATRLSDGYLAPPQVVHEIAIPRQPSSAMTWLNIGLSGLFAFGAALAFVQGDQKAHYNGWFVALGWALVLLAWRTFANRKRGALNPVKNLAQGIGLATLAGVGLIVQLVMVMAGIFVILGLLTVAEHVLGHT